MQHAEQNLYFYVPQVAMLLHILGWKKRKMKRAESTAIRLQKQYPKNIISLQLLGRIYMYENKFARSEQTFKR